MTDLKNPNQNQMLSSQDSSHDQSPSHFLEVKNGMTKSTSRTFLNGELAEQKRLRKHNGTLVICVQNLAVSGANAVLLNIVKGGFHQGNIIVLSPEKGELSPFFQEAGVAVRYGDLAKLLEVVSDVRIVICNTIMTAHYVLLLREKGIPHCWILHEWWPKDVLQSQLGARKYCVVSPEIVSKALELCTHIVYVCNGQRKLYGSSAASSVIPIGVPDPEPSFYTHHQKFLKKSKRGVTFLCLGIVCPRKNQVTAVEFFKECAGDRKDVRLVIVGARHERDYEIEYLKQVKAAAGNDSRIAIHDCTLDVEPYYAEADILLMTSSNEVTPLTISEAMLRGIPVITSDIAGIPDMLSDGVEGYVVNLNNRSMWIQRMTELANDTKLISKMGAAAAERAKKQYSMGVMIESYRKVVFTLTPPMVLIDMDGVLVDWDSGFRKVWGNRPLKERNHYEMELCVPSEYAEEVKRVYSEQGFFLNLPPMPGAIKALNEIASRGYIVHICTRPVLSSYCVQEKYEWVRKHLGEEWMTRIITTNDKTVCRGTLLIDDHPNIRGSRFPSWRQVIFDQPYNRNRKDLPRLTSWNNWERLFAEELMYAPKHNPIKPEKLSLLPRGRKRYSIIRNLSWSQQGKSFGAPEPKTPLATILETIQKCAPLDGIIENEPTDIIVDA